MVFLLSSACNFLSGLLIRSCADAVPREQCHEVRRLAIRSEPFLLERARAHRGRGDYDGSIAARLHARLAAPKLLSYLSPKISFIAGFADLRRRIAHR